MRIVLLALDREPERAQSALRKMYPQATIEILPLSKVETGGPMQRLSALRSMKPEIFAVSTERVGWQQGQHALIVFGAMAGARQSLIFDPHGASRLESRAQILRRAPLRFAREAALSRKTIRLARNELKRLEQEVARRGKSASRTSGNHTPVRITYLRTSPAAGTQSGGALTHTVGFIDGATAVGADVEVLTNDELADLDRSKVSMTVFAPRPEGITRAAFDLRNGMLFTEQAGTAIAPQPPDFIYQRYSRFNWTGVQAGLQTDRPLFLEYNGSEVWIAKHWGRLQHADLLERIERLNLTAADRIFVVAEVERNNLLKAGVPAEKIVVNPNGVDIDRFRPAIGGASIRRELGIEENEVLAGFVGTFGPWHGVLTLAEAITLLPLDRKIRFLLVGAGMYRDQVARIASEAGRDPQVIFTGQVDHQRVPPLLDACDLLLSPHAPMIDGSDFFGSPTKLFEYMSMGKAIVASRLGQIGEILIDEETALLVEPGNARQLAAAIKRLAEAGELRHRLGSAARREAVEKYTWKKNAQRVIDEYLALNS